ILFLARVPSVGFATFDVRPSFGDSTYSPTALKATKNTLENARFKVTLNAAGDIASVFDKTNHKEALKSPARLAFQYENPSQFPAWNMDWDDAQKPPRGYVTGPATIRIVENGPARVALQVTRETDGSKYVQTIRLAAGDAGNRVEVANTIDWQTQQTALKASFPLTTGNPEATYDLQVGTVQRGNNDPKKYEVPQHQWFDLTGTDGKYGVAVLNDSKFGSDKPDDDTVRLTLLYTPGVRGGYQDQATQDIGRHDILYALAPHTGDWRQGNVPWQAKRLNQPLMAFTAPAHAGTLGKTFSLLGLNTNQVQVEAIKKAEDSNEIIVRLRELLGKPANSVRVKMAGRIVSAREVNGQELPLGAATVTNGVLTTDVHAYGLRAFALTVGPAPAKVTAVQSAPVTLAYNLDAVSLHSKLNDGAFDAQGRTLAGEQLPAQITTDGVTFQMGPTTDGAKNAVACHGQTITLPTGYTRAYLLAAATQDALAKFAVGTRTATFTVQNWGGYIGQWDNRLWLGDVPELTYDWHNAWGGLVPGYIKNAEVAWFSSHRHNPTTGNEPYEYSYLFKYGLTIPAGAKTLTLPNDPRIRVFAVSVAKGAHDAVRATAPLSDTLADHAGGNTPLISPPGGKFNDVTTVTLTHPLYWREGGLHYTLDGSAPTASSPVYTNPITVNARTTIRATEIDINGKPGPVTVALLDVHDTTAPKLLTAEALQGLARATARFSEPVTKASAEDRAHYQIASGVKVTSAALGEDGRAVSLTLDRPLPLTEQTQITVTGIKDVSPGGNMMTAQTLALASGGQAFSQAQFAPHTPKVFPVPDLPTTAHAPWTINFFCRMTHQPDNRTVIAGFGRASDGQAGTGRYLSKFANGIHFWSANSDVETTTPLDLNQWQMLTATYDGHTLRVYKNAEPIAEQKVDLADDEANVHVMPKDPWEHERIFDGDVRDMTIWKQALTPDSLKTLWDAGKTP
nr:chitobiase/beta-hexosaminidase C-terminal domain-containing protein [Armatimonadota bacterium]